MAAQNGRAEELRDLLKLGDLTSLQALDIHGTLARLAAEGGHVNVLHTLVCELGDGSCLLTVNNYQQTPAHLAARNGHTEVLLALHQLGAAATLTAEDIRGFTPAHFAAERGHAPCLHVLHKCGDSQSLRAFDRKHQTPAHLAAEHGHVNALHVMRKLDATSLSGVTNTGRTSAHSAALNGCSEVLLALHQLGAAATLTAEDMRGHTPAHYAASRGYADCLRVLCEQCGAESLAAVNRYGDTLAHRAAVTGHAHILRVLKELGNGANLVTANDNGSTPAHDAAEFGHAHILRVLRELGAEASLVAADSIGSTPAHRAAEMGHVHILRVLRELGAGASLVAADRNGSTPAHVAADVGHANILRVLKELGAGASLLAADDDGSTPAHRAAYHEQKGCLQFLVEIGGATSLWTVLAKNPYLIDAEYAWLCSDPALLDLRCKKAWLGSRFAQLVENDNDLTLSLVRGNILSGLCTQLGVDEATGAIADDTAPVGIDVKFTDEASVGDGLRRECFGQALAELLDPRYGLFRVNECGRKLEPNPTSATTAGPDHLSYFALLGRIAGLALYHGETLDAPLTSAFLKAAFGYAVTHADLQTDHPVLHANQTKLLVMTDDELAAAELTFSVDGEEEIVYNGSKRRRSTELKPGGCDIHVAHDNVHEYLQLYAEHHLVHAIQPQLQAFRGGLRVFMSERLGARIRECCTPTELNLLLCGVDKIDVDDWECSAQYSPDEYRESAQVRWLWSAVRKMNNEERSKLLRFCTGSAKPPATGFDSLPGYGGQMHRFRVSRVDDAGRLPTASTCFNCLHLPAYVDEAELQVKLHEAIANAQGFHEAAVAIL